MSDPFIPKIIGFCCRYWAYSAADLAGSMRLQYPPEIKVILMPCTGRVDILHLLKAFEGGADVVFVAGCLEGECHYLSGNIQARKRVTKLKKDLEALGLESERLEMYNMSSSEGPKFAAMAEEVAERAYRLGPSPVRQEAREAWLAEQPKASGQ